MKLINLAVLMSTDSDTGLTLERCFATCIIVELSHDTHDVPFSSVDWKL